MAPKLTVELSESVARALSRRAGRSGVEAEDLVDGLLADALGVTGHSIYQVSTSSALVRGVLEGAVTVEELSQHGDFGLGTFAQLDGEMVMLDGVCYRSTAGGETAEARADRQVPFAMVTFFEPDTITSISAADLTDTTRQIDRLRPSRNLFMGIKSTGRFESISLRAICRAQPGESLVEAASHQSEFEINGVQGTLVGFWSPEYAGSVAIPGYHLHFLSDDRRSGGHVMRFDGRDLEVALHIESDLHLALPEDGDFLTTNLSGDHTEQLARVETDR